MKEYLFFFRVITPMHIGVGSGIGHIDLPIYREVPTNFPAIPASSIKGVLRQRWLESTLKHSGKGSLKEYDEALEKGEDESPCVKLSSKIFGSQKGEGSLVVYDGRILFFPVRSVKGIFAYVTCPYVLKRFEQDTNIAVTMSDYENLKDGETIVLNSEEIVYEKGDKLYLVLEEFAFSVCERRNDQLWNLAKKIGIRPKRIAVVSDSVFSHMVESYTEVQTHTKIDLTTGTVEEGALWTEEYVPPETIFYVKMQLLNSGQLPDCEEVKFSSWLSQEVKALMIGGNTTTGKGLVEVVNYDEKAT
ncbi:type III-B CRISPR module RAMP protein Cmr4 [Thermocrinis minervae]|uniref:CRISPR-associated protein, Cmr4 family n=1 Tax=Thermocrinis minervae TaxID=381751 RepID=A0A1M6QUF7_9AQUI|nr:type III-B CRISPR module RAMP protein Cmr4 [Thermocrinis minervae]SHK23750.1 CRISPR-associated protein, Cmr4 family [Thermocrinis minervae]